MEYVKLQGKLQRVHDMHPCNAIGVEDLGIGHINVLLSTNSVDGVVDVVEGTDINQEL